MKFTKQIKKELAIIESDITKINDFIYRDDILFCSKGDVEYSNSFKNKNGDIINSMNKFCGSNLCLIEDTLKRVKDLINENK